MSEAILDAVRENTARLDRLILLLGKAPLDWVDPDEAATILGIRLTKSGHHRRRVRWLAKQGFLKKFRPGKPFLYWRSELKEVAKKIEAGEVVPAGIV